MRPGRTCNVDARDHDPVDPVLSRPPTPPPTKQNLASSPDRVTFNPTLTPFSCVEHGRTLHDRVSGSLKRGRMKWLGLLLASGIVVLAGGCAVNHTGLAGPERHGLEIDSNTVRVELRDFNNATVFSTGENRNRQGELHSYSVQLSATSERFIVPYTNPSDILNATKGNRGGTGYVDIDVNDHLVFTDGNSTDDNGEDRLKPTPWVNARRGATIEILVTARELDCVGQNVCNRDDFGSVTYSMNIPLLPDTLPTTCQEFNSYRGSQVDGVYLFIGMVDPRRTAVGRPIIEPGVTAHEASLCILPPE